MTTRQPANAVVLVIDLQTAMFDGVAVPPIHGADVLVERARAVTRWARATGRKVAFIRHDGAAGEVFAPGAPGWAVWPALGQAPEEPTFSKTEGDAFSQPDVGDWVAGAGASEVILLGAQTDQCVAATVRGALDRGLTVSVVSDAHSTWDLQDETADQVVLRHNAMFASAGARVITTAALTEA